MMRIALGVEYKGHEFYGWQSQRNLATIQSLVEQALGKIAAQEVSVFCAGRTDAGVHATGQVIHFDTEVARESRAWVFGANSHLPPSIAIRWAKEVSLDFHARFSAEARAYHYVIFNHAVRPAIISHLATWHSAPLDENKMQLGANHLLGEQNFTSFRSSQCESRTPMRNVHEIKIIRQGHFIIIKIQANAFLHHMVRNIVGVLLRIGSGCHSPSWALEVLKAQDRTQGAETASPDGLYLTNVTYPSSFDLPAYQNSFFGILQSIQ